MASLLASALPILGSIGQAVLPAIGGIAKEVLPEVGKVLAGSAGNQLDKMSPEAKEAFCQCEKKQKYKEAEESERQYRQGPMDAGEDYGYYIDEGRIGVRPRRKKHLTKRRRY